MKLLIIVLLTLVGSLKYCEVHATTCRSESVKKAFDRLSGYPGGRPSLAGEEQWIVDHWCALECGGIDDPSNMVYQQYSMSKIKDLWERTPAGCIKTCNSKNSTVTRQVFNCIGGKIPQGAKHGK